MNEKTILKLYQNGDFETINTDIIQSGIVGNYAFNENEITVPNIIEFPPNELKNYFIKKTSVPGWVADFEQWGIPPGEINPPYDNDDRTSDFIDVSEWNDFTVRIVQENLILLHPYFRVVTYDSNKKYNGIFYEGAFQEYIFENQTLITTLNVTLNDDVKYIRVSINHYDKPFVTTKITVNKGITSSEKYYLALEDMPEWVRNTGNPISIFKEGIVIKGDLIQSPHIFYDNFNRADANILGGRWVVGEGDFYIVNGTAKATKFLQNNTAFVDVGESDNLSIECKISPFKSEAIVLRCVDVNNYIQVIHELGVLFIRIKKNGVTSTLKSYAVNGTFHTTRVELRGSEIKVFNNGVLVMTHTTNEFLGATKFGFKSWTDIVVNNMVTVGHYDDFTITKLTD